MSFDERLEHGTGGAVAEILDQIRYSAAQQFVSRDRWTKDVREGGLVDMHALFRFQALQQREHGRVRPGLSLLLQILIDLPRCAGAEPPERLEDIAFGVAELLRIGGHRAIIRNG